MRKRKDFGCLIQTERKMSFRIATGVVSFSLNILNRSGEKKSGKRKARKNVLVEGEVVNLNGIEIIYLNN